MGSGACEQFGLPSGHGGGFPPEDCEGLEMGKVVKRTRAARRSGFTVRASFGEIHRDAGFQFITQRQNQLLLTTCNFVNFTYA